MINERRAPKRNRMWGDYTSDCNTEASSGSNVAMGPVVYFNMGVFGDSSSAGFGHFASKREREL